MATAVLRSPDGRVRPIWRFLIAAVLAFLCWISVGLLLRPDLISPLAVIAFADPLRDDVPPAIRQARDAGIQTVVVTGDHPMTARHRLRDDVTTGVAGSSEDDDASHAVSLYSVVDHIGQKAAWLTMRPVTGRTHQLRVHALHIGHPIIGDPKYFDDDPNWDFPGGVQKKLHLHARHIDIPHPTGGRLRVSAPLPSHMVQTWNLLGLDLASAERDAE